jgi:5-methylcytosine-specific restriction endonuclease McrA
MSRESRGLKSGMKTWLKKSYDHTCQYCGKRGASTFDHIIPLSKGGSRGSSNVTLACADCNGKKGNEVYPEEITNRLLEEAERRVIAMDMLTVLKNRKKWIAKNGNTCR